MEFQSVPSVSEGEINRILMVCMGNICRSPTAEAVARAKAQAMGLTLELDSAGTIGYHAGESPDRRARAAGERRGLDFSGIKARQVRARDFAHFDLILAADRENLQALHEACPQIYKHKLALMLDFADTPIREVPDPYYGGDSGFEQVLDLLELSIAGLFARIQAARPRSIPPAR
ncbi:MAG: low molecular weight protein-tyrosine-phosphatase [Shewanella algae]